MLVLRVKKTAPAEIGPGTPGSRPGPIMSTRELYITMLYIAKRASGLAPYSKIALDIVSAGCFHQHKALEAGGSTSGGVYDPPRAPGFQGHI